MKDEEFKSAIIEHAGEHGAEHTMKVCLLFIKQVALNSGGFQVDCGDGVFIDVSTEEDE